jgi:hypothetical protein
MDRATPGFELAGEKMVYCPVWRCPRRNARVPR